MTDIASTVSVLPSRDAGKPREARNVRNGFWVYVDETARWSEVVRVEFPGRGVRRIVTASTAVVERAAHSRVRCLSIRELKALGLRQVNPEVAA